MLGIHKLTMFAGKAIGHLLDAVTPENVKAGIISNYGVPEAVVDRRDLMFAKQRTGLREAGEILSDISSITRNEARVLYEAATNPDAAAVEKMIADLPPESKTVLGEIKKMVHDLGVEAVRLGQLSDDTFKRNEWSYLHRSYTTHELNMSEGEVRNRKRAMAVWADSYRHRGLSDLVDMSKIKNAAPEFWKRKLQTGKADVAMKNVEFTRYERRANRGEGVGTLAGVEASTQKGKLLEVHYWPTEERPPLRYSGWDNAGVWKATGTKGDKLVMWRDFTKAEREKMGEIDDIRYAFAKTMTQMVHNVEVGKYFEWLANNHAVEDAGDLPRGSIIKKASESLGSTFAKDHWVEVPDTPVIKGGPLKYGKLGGLLLPGPIWNDVRQVAGFKFMPWGETYNAILRAWKISKALALYTPIPTP
ncbi:MAG: hypothetical protein ACREUY_00965, partial [Burkholderiales bacterium]